MRLMGASAPDARPVLTEVADACRAGRAVYLWSDGEDVMAVVADEGDTFEAFAAMAARVAPQELRA